MSITTRLRWDPARDVLDEPQGLVALTAQAVSPAATAANMPPTAQYRHGFKLYLPIASGSGLPLDVLILTPGRYRFPPSRLLDPDVLDFGEGRRRPGLSKSR